MTITTHQLNSFIMFTPAQQKMLDTFEAFLQNTPNHILQKKIEQIAEMNFLGSSVDDYFANFPKDFIQENICDESFVENWEQSYINSRDIIFDLDQSPFFTITLNKTETPYNSYAIAA